jgi:allantoinase
MPLELKEVARLTTWAARWLRLPRKGAIVIGADADLALVDPAATWVIDPATLWSRHRLSPYAGRSVRGQVVRTLVRGKTVHTRDEGAGEAGGGQLLRPGPRSVRLT